MATIAEIEVLRLKLAMREAAYLLAYDHFSDAEVAAREIRMIEAHRGLHEACR
jgi:hypothetical protein